MLLQTVILCFAVGASAIPAKVRIALSPDGKIAAHIQTNDDVIRLNLQKSASPIFHPNIKVVEVDGEGNHYDVTPSKSILDDFENSIFEDKNQDAVVRLANGKGLHGLINGKFIRNENGEHDISDATPLSQETIDFVSIPGDPQTWLHSQTRKVTIQATANVELLLVVDYYIYKWFTGYMPAITEYYGLFVKGVNNLYASSADPSINFKIVGLYVLNSPSSQPFIENNRISGGVNIGQVLTDFGNHMTTNAGAYPPYDAVSLLTGEPSGGVIGIAWIGGTCQTTWKTSITQDRNGSFYGVHTMAHELGHNLGSPHDGDGGSAACNVNDGYIMHPAAGSDANRFRFSECSKQMMKNYISSSSGSCLFTKNSPGTPWAVPYKNPGDMVDMNAYCKKFVRPDSYPRTDMTPDQLCANLWCEWIAPCNPPAPGYTCYSMISNGIAAPDGAPCGKSGGHCNSGKCI